MEERDRCRIWSFREERQELQTNTVSFAISDCRFEVWVRLDASFVFAPVEVVEPCLFGVFEPRPCNAELGAGVGVFEDRGADSRELSELVEVF